MKESGLSPPNGESYEPGKVAGGRPFEASLEGAKSALVIKRVGEEKKKKKKYTRSHREHSNSDADRQNRIPISTTGKDIHTARIPLDALRGGFQDKT